MKEIAFFMLPLGALSAVLLSVPWRGLQRSCIRICNLRVSLGRYLSVRLCTAFLLYNVLRFVTVCVKLMGGAGAAYVQLLKMFPSLSALRFFTWMKPSFIDGSPSDSSSSSRDQPVKIPAPTAGYFPVEAGQQNQLHALYDIRVQARVLRYQRDFWITLFAAFLWLFVCCAAFLIRRYWRALQQAHDAYEKVLQERRRVESVAAAKAATAAARALAFASSSSSSASASSSFGGERELTQRQVPVKEVELATRDSRHPEEVKTRRKNNDEVERTSFITPEEGEEEEEMTTVAAAAKDEKDDIFAPAITARRRRPPVGNAKTTAVCRGEEDVQEKHILD